MTYEGFKSENDGGMKVPLVLAQLSSCPDKVHLSHFYTVGNLAKCAWDFFHIDFNAFSQCSIYTFLNALLS